MTVQEIEGIGKKNALNGNVSLTPEQCDTLKNCTINGMVAKAENSRFQNMLTAAVKAVSSWKQRYKALYDKYRTLKKKPSPIWTHWKLRSKRFGLLF